MSVRRLLADCARRLRCNANVPSRESKQRGKNPCSRFAGAVGVFALIVLSLGFWAVVCAEPPSPPGHVRSAFRNSVSPSVSSTRVRLAAADDAASDVTGTTRLESGVVTKVTSKSSGRSADPHVAAGERVFGTRSEDDLDEQQDRTLLDSIRELPSGEAKASLLTRITRLFIRNHDLSKARQTALQAGEKEAAEKVRMLVLIADAERATGQRQQAWWTLHEAQQAALKLKDVDTLITVFREIGAVETKLNRDGKNASAVAFTSAECPIVDTDCVIEAAIRDGLPDPGYREIEILREGGGPLREPMVLRHTYYFNGCRTFQGPRLRGGPAIVQVVHPRTQCLLSIPVTMPTGAPVVAYQKNAIQYVFPKVVLEIEFKRSGRYELEYHRPGTCYASYRRKVLGQRSTTPSAATPIGTTVTNLLSLGLGGPVNLGSRLPVLSDILELRQKRIPATLVAPTR